MGSITNDLEIDLLDHVLETAAYTPSSQLYMSLHTVDPAEGGSIANEISGNGYARTAIAFSAASSRNVIQNGQVTFPQVVTAPWGTITHFGICFAGTGSVADLIGYGAFDNSIVTEVGNVPFVPDLETVISINSGGASDYLALELLDLAFRNDTGFGQPDIHVALADSAISDGTTGTTISEPGGNYARVDFADWTAAAAGQADNNSDIVFTTPNTDWNTITYSALLDAASTGNLLIYATATPNQAPKTGDPVKIPTGDYIVTMD
jgi:hypothetical protein